jgi:hypothetical protein
MTTKTKIIISVVLLASSFAAGRFTLPAKVLEKEVVKTVEKVVEKKIYVKDTTKKNNKVTITFTTIKPDGTKTIEKKVFDKNEIELTQREDTSIKDDKAVDKDKEKTVINDKDSFVISAGAKININNPNLSYGILVDKRAIGPFHLGAFGFTDTSFGMTVGIGF